LSRSVPIPVLTNTKGDGNATKKRKCAADNKIGIQNVKKSNEAGRGKLVIIQNWEMRMGFGRVNESLKEQ